MNGSEFALARYYALQAVKQQWKDRGKRLPEFGELRREANDYLDNHPELIEFATERYRSLVAKKTKAVQDLRHTHSNGSADR
jgi:hypothetical protein